MAIDEREREDLLRDGWQMPLRGDCVIEGIRVLCGFRSGDQLSLYCGGDPVFQFNASQELRRAFYQGRRFAAQQGRLTELSREKRGGRVQFVSRTVDGEMRMVINSALRQWLAKIQYALESRPGEWRSVDDQLVPLQQRLSAWFDSLPNEIPIALSPNA